MSFWSMSQAHLIKRKPSPLLPKAVRLKKTVRRWKRTIYPLKFFLPVAYLTWGIISRKDDLSWMTSAAMPVLINAPIRRVFLALQPVFCFQFAPNDLQDDRYKSSKKVSRFDRFLLHHFIDNYLRFHEVRRGNRRARLLVFRPHPTGIGDKFERLITAYYVAVTTRRVFLVDWQNPTPIEDLIETGRNPGTDMFFRMGIDDIDIDSATNSKSTEFDLDRRRTHNCTNFISALYSNQRLVVMTMSHRPLLSTLDRLGRLRFGNLTSRRLSAFIGSHICRRVFMHQVFKVRQDFLNNMVREGFNLKISPPRRNIFYNRKFLMDSNAPDYVAVHARVGVGLGETGVRFDRFRDNLDAPARCLAQRAVNLVNLFGNKFVPIFLTTDTDSFRSYFVRAVEEESNKKISVIHGEWNTVHSYLNIEKKSENGKTSLNTISDDSMRTMLATYIDLVLLGRARHIIGLRSSFVRFAYAIGNATTLAQISVNICLNNAPLTNRTTIGLGSRFIPKAARNYSHR